MRLATFDIFDTTLIRLCGSPDVIFDLVARKLWPSDEALRTAFLNSRRQSAHTAGSDASLSDIYGCFAADEFAPLSIEVLMNEELDTERRMLTVNPVVRDRIHELRRAGWEIKFLSDMYLSSAFLSEVLMREGCLEDAEEVIVSCEWKARKDNGSLYRLVRKKYNPREWIHFGDNKRSDIRMARRNGVKGIWISTSYTQIEQRIYAQSINLRYGWQLKLLAGVSRAARLTAGNTPEAILAADFVAATYIPFVLYVLSQARIKGIKKLHFLSRDGYIMFHIAKALGGDQFVELNYLYVSRRSLMRAYLYECSIDRYLEIADRKTLISRSVDHLLWQLQLTRKQLKDNFGIEFCYTKILSLEQQTDFLSKLFKHPVFTPWLQRHFSEDASLTYRYLVQEGLSDSYNQAMVDVGWLGTSRMMINSILRENGKDALIPTFYLGVRGDVYSRMYGDYFSYFDSGQLDTYATNVIENYMSASPYPTTIGYTEQHNIIAPVFPDGQKYQENAIVRTNVDMCTRMSATFKPYLDYFSKESLFAWSKISLDSFSNLKDDLDIHPLTMTGSFDDMPMACKLSIKQLNVVLSGGQVTAFDRGSLHLTVGHKLGRRLWKLHTIFHRIREVFYHKFILKK